MSSESFLDLGVPADMIASLTRRGITAPFPIQAAVLADALAGDDVCGRAPTGSGKTLAFGIPLAAAVERARPGRPRGLVLVPTRELAAQVQRELEPLAATRGRSVASFYGGVSFGPQLAALRKGPDIAVACPGRLADLVMRGNVRLDDVAVVVIDEADRMADMGFLPEVRRLLDRVRPDRQTLLFSATLDGDVDVLIRNYQRDPARHEIAVDDDTAELTEHVFLRTPREQRVGIAAKVVADAGSSIVFCRTKHGADRLARQLDQAGVSAAAIHGNRSQGQRERALAAFAGGHVQALVATDVAARGIHVDDVGCVLHYDPPADVKGYVHRSGRTARAGSTGRVVTLVTDDQVALVRTLQRSLSLPEGTTTLDGGPRSTFAPATAPDKPTAAPARRQSPTRPGAPRRSGAPAGRSRRSR